MHTFCLPHLKSFVVHFCWDVWTDCTVTKTNCFPGRENEVLFAALLVFWWKSAEVVRT